MLAGWLGGRKGADGMSELRGLLDPEARATLDAVLAKLAAPGMANPDDHSPVCGWPTQCGGRANRSALPAAAQLRRPESDGPPHVDRVNWVSTRGFRPP